MRPQSSLELLGDPLLTLILSKNKVGRVELGLSRSDTHLSLKGSKSGRTPVQGRIKVKVSTETRTRTK